MARNQVRFRVRTQEEEKSNLESQSDRSYILYVRYMEKSQEGQVSVKRLQPRKLVITVVKAKANGCVNWKNQLHRSLQA